MSEGPAGYFTVKKCGLCDQIYEGNSLKVWIDQPFYAEIDAGSGNYEPHCLSNCERDIVGNFVYMANDEYCLCKS